MRSLRITLPDSEYSFFMEFVKHLKNTKVEDDSTNDFILTVAHKKLLDERLREAKENPKQIISEKEFNTRMKENFS